MLFPSDPYLAENAAYRVYSTRKKEAGKFAITHVHVVKRGSIGKMNAVFPPWPIREFRDRSDGIPESGREDSIFRGAGAFFGASRFLGNRRPADDACPDKAKIEGERPKRPRINPVRNRFS